jgi:predicted transcriptional regulator
MSAIVVRKVICRIELELECDEDVKCLFDLLNEAEDLPDSLQELKEELELTISHFA